MSDFVEETTTFSKPKVSKTAQKELDKAEVACNAFESEVKELTLDRMNEAPKLETEQQTKLSSKDIQNSKDVYLKPHKTHHDRNKFNEKFREAYNLAKEYVHFIAEHKEMQGESIEMWTKPFAGVPAEMWIVPTNKPIWAPRYVAEQIKRRTYHRMSMNEGISSETNHVGQMYGRMIVDNTVQRLDAYPVSSRKSIFT